MASPNRLQRTLSRLDLLPGVLRTAARTFALRRAIPFTGTAGLEFAVVTVDQSEIRVANKKQVHNHIGGVHAAAMALLAETASGMVVGMNVRDDCLPLCKTMPPINWTSKCRIPNTRTLASRTTAKASGNNASREVPDLMRSRKASVLARNSASDKACI